jgi:hypothetical protein
VAHAAAESAYAFEDGDEREAAQARETAAPAGVAEAYDINRRGLVLEAAACVGSAQTLTTVAVEDEVAEEAEVDGIVQGALSVRSASDASQELKRKASPAMGQPVGDRPPKAPKNATDAIAHGRSRLGNEMAN